VLDGVGEVDEVRHERGEGRGARGVAARGAWRIVVRLRS
jgi:hypothetical protein